MVELADVFECLVVCVSRLQNFTIYRARVELGYFGADSRKPIFVYANVPWVSELPLHPCRNWYPTSERVTKVPLPLVV